MNQKKLRA